MLPVKSFSSLIEMKNRIRNRFKGKVDIPPQGKRVVTQLPENGASVTVETALNSRCTSDYDDAQELFHWGMFNRHETLSDEQINTVSDYIRIPRLTKHRADVKVDGNSLIFIIDNTVSGSQKSLLMIESGMQQQAVCLICAALGVGMVFKSLGANGKALSGADLATVKIKLDAMKPSYSGQYWNTQPPNGLRPWLKGNLPDPDRIGTKSLLEILSDLQPQSTGSNQLTDNRVGQLLWAARGRTPHLYKSRAWGMTIPTSRGEQNNTSIYYSKKGQLNRYINWSNGRPTHLLKQLTTIKPDWRDNNLESLSHNSCCIIITVNKKYEKAYWEVGYQLLNIFLQARALDMNYKMEFIGNTNVDTRGFVETETPVVAIYL